MHQFTISRIALALTLMFGVYGPKAVFADGDINKVNHVIVLMQTSHSFDNYFGALAYAPGSPYHNGGGACAPTDQTCVDGLTCAVDQAGNFSCSNQNVDASGRLVSSFHESRRCEAPAFDSSWLSTHLELNFLHPNRMSDPTNDGFLLANDDGVQDTTVHQAMAFYTQNELPFYYDLAQKFAIGDRYFASVAGPGFPNRAYLMAGTSFGHVTADETFPPPGGYRPITGTIFDLFNVTGVSWANYFQDVAQAGSFLPVSQSSGDSHFLPLATFLSQVAGAPGAGPLPQVSFVDPDFGLSGRASENDERPPTDIQRGQAFVSRVVNAVRNGPYWRDSVIFITYDQHGGFYDHVAPPPALQGGMTTPDGIAPGQCADLSNPPLSQEPGWGAECWENPFKTRPSSIVEAGLLCLAFNSNQTGPYPPWCATFDHLGVRVPFLVVSTFAKPRYVSHVTGDHTSILAFIERRFLTRDGQDPLYLTARDMNANTFNAMFDFDNSPSLNTAVMQAPPGNDCTTPVGIPPQPHRVLLSWAAGPSSVSAYAVYRGDTAGGPYTKITSTPGAITAYTDSSVLSGHTYYYVVTSLDLRGDESSYSNEAGAAIPSS